MTTSVSAVRFDLLARCFPMTAARYACRCPIPLPRSSVATEVAVCISTIDRDAHNALPPDAAGNVCPGTGNLTVRNRQRRACRWLTAAGFGYNCNTPETIIGRLGDGGSGGEGRGGESKRQKSDAIVAHESNPRMNVMTRLIQAHCVQNLLHRGNTKSSLPIKHLMVNLVPVWNKNPGSPAYAGIRFCK